MLPSPWRAGADREDEVETVMTNTELCYTSATELTQMIRSKTVPPVELTQAVLQRLERLNPILNCFRASSG